MHKSFFLKLIIFLGAFSELSANQSYEWSQRVYLATYPRSGNHWMRYLLEDSTNIITSSVYTDPNHTEVGVWGGYHKPMGYFGNCVFPKIDEPVIVKTHYPCFDCYPFDLLPSIKTIRIVRHPIDSIYSFYLYDGGKKGSKIPDNQLNYYIDSWKRFQEYWDEQENVLTIYYEDILENPKELLELALSESGFHASEENIEHAIQHNPPQGSILKHLIYFTKKGLELIMNKIGELMLKYDYELPVN